MLCAVYLGRKIQPAYHTDKRFKKHIEEHLTGSKALRVVMLQPVSKVDVSLVPSGGCRFVLKYLRLWASGLSLLICFQTGVVFPIYGGKAHVIAPDTRPRVTVASLANEQQCHLPPSAEQRTHIISTQRTYKGHGNLLTQLKCDLWFSKWLMSMFLKVLCGRCLNYCGWVKQDHLVLSLWQGCISYMLRFNTLHSMSEQDCWCS